MKPILLLDVMGTLVHDPFYVEVPAFFGMSLAQLIEAKTPHVWVDFELGRIDEATFLSSFFRDRRSFDHDGLKRCMASSYQLLDGVESLLQELRLREVEMHALSNYPSWYEAIERTTRLSRFLEWSFVSCDLALRKPDVAIYHACTERLHVDASRCIFVDDRDENCVAAREVGMEAIRFDGADALRSRLVDRGVL